MSNYPLPTTVRPNKTLIFKAYTPNTPGSREHLTPDYLPFDLADPPPPGGFTIKNHYLILDPHLRGQLRLPWDQRTYPMQWIDGEPAVLTTVGTVMKSDHPNFKAGDHVPGMANAAQYATVSAQLASMADLYPTDIPPYHPSLSIAGLSAYMSFTEFIAEFPFRVVPGKTLFVSAASSSIDQLVGEMGKIYGMRVIGSTDCDEKVQFLVNELGFDGAWNSNKIATAEALMALAPNGVDTFYDLVGREQLETTLTRMNEYGNIVSCGMTSVSNPDEDEQGVRTLINIIKKKLTVNWFLYTDPWLLQKYMPRFTPDMLAWIRDGKIKPKTETLIGIDLAPEAMVKLLEEEFSTILVKVGGN